MTTLGIRNRNPGNIIDGAFAQGRPGYLGSNGRFAVFHSMGHGIAALIALLKIYRKQHKLTTVRGIINRWAPPVENDTSAYVLAVCDGWVRPDEELPDTPETYLFLAQRIARHECAPDHVQITSEDWEQGMALAGLPAPATPAPEASPPVTEPTPASEEKKMPAPFLWAAAQMLIPLVADLFRGHGGSTATRNADLVEKVGAPLVEIAKVVTGTSTEQEAAQAIVGDPTLQAKFREAVAVDLDRLVGMIERLTIIDDESRDRAAARAAAEKVDFAPTLIRNQFWMLGALAAATVIAFMLALALKADNEILVGLMVLFTGLVNGTAQKWATMIEYRFGSSAGSAAKDVVIAGSRKG